MRMLLTAIAVVVAVVIWTSREPVVERSASFSPASSYDVASLAEQESASESLMNMTPPPEASPAFGAEPADGGVSIIGEPMDPVDLSTWPQPESTDMINIGELVDPGDPATWPRPQNTEVINIGEPMDPDDPSTWPQPNNTDVINIGEPMDPYDPSTWPQPDTTEVINIGEPMNPNEPLTR